MTAKALTLLAPSGFPEVQPGAALDELVARALEADGISLESGDILVFAQKIVSKSEGRLRRLSEVVPSERAIELAARSGKDERVVELVLRESRAVLRCVSGVLIVEDVRGFVMANAGIDASNVRSPDGQESVLLLPEDPDASAQRLRDAFSSRFGVPVGVVINDSWGRAWRNGTVGTAIGVAGLPGLLDLRGTLDRQGRPLMTTEVGIADEVAAAASMLMGQAGEGRPVVLVRGFPYELRPGRARELVRPSSQDLFR